MDSTDKSDPKLLKELNYLTCKSCREPPHSYAPQYAKDRLERHQSLCLRIIYPEIQSYSLRTETAGLQRITDHLMSLCIRYTTKIANNDTHRLHSLLPPRQSAIGRHSSRLVDKRQLTARTSLKMRSVFSLLE